MKSGVVYTFFSLILFFTLSFTSAEVLPALGIESGTGPYEIISYTFIVLAFLSGALAINSIIGYFIWEKYFYNKLHTKAPRLLRDITLIVIFIITITIIIGFVFKQPLTGFWATSGLTAIIIGFALRNMILDLFSGLAINIDRPYMLGDWIEIHQRMSTETIIGKVIEISWRATHVKTEQNTIVVIPNSVMTSIVVITNYYKKELDTRYEIYFTLDYSISTERAKRVIFAGALEAVEKEGFSQNIKPQVLIDKTTELGIVYKVRYWITPWKDISPSTSRDEMHSKILKHLWHAGLTLAYPKEDVFYAKMPTRQLDDDLFEDRKKLLSKVKLFTDLNQDEISLLARSMIRRKVPDSDFVVKVGENGDSMFVLLEGLLDVFITEKNNKEIKVSQLTPSDYFGEMSLLTGEGRTASVRASIDSIVYEIKKEDINGIFHKRKELIESIVTKMNERKAANEQHLISDHMINREAILINKSLIKKIKSFFGVT